MHQTDWRDIFKKRSVFFVSPDIKWGLGLEDLSPNYHLICSYYDVLIPVLRKNGVNVFCLQENSESLAKNTANLLEENLVSQYILKNSSGTPYIAFFKPSLKLDYLIKEKKYKKIGNSNTLNEKFENKINLQYLGLAGLKKYLLPFLFGKLLDFDFDFLSKKFKIPFVIQFGRGWAGKTTFFINSKKDFADLKMKFPQTSVRISPNVSGYTVLNNCCIYNFRVLVSEPALQLNGWDVLSEVDHVTCGRQWPIKLISAKMKKEIRNISGSVGNFMAESGYRGFFGIDFLIEEKSGRIYVSEINARPTASSAFYTKLELAKGITPLLFYHYASFLDIDIPIKDYSFESIEGSQVIFRNEKSVSLLNSPDLAVYDLNKNDFVKSPKFYQPGKLEKGQFIFHREKSLRLDSEIARIETLMPAFVSPSHPQNWLKSWLRAKIG